MDNKQRKLIFLGVLLCGCVLTGLAGDYGLGGKKQEPPPVVQQSAAAVKDGSSMKVYVSGAVAEPGLYDLPSGARALQAVEAAGGILPEADATRVNLAKRLKDGSQVNVPLAKGSVVRPDRLPAVRENKKSAAADRAALGKVRLNTATAAELDGLPGIGPSLARRIIERRRQQRFSRIEDLLEVKGIGRAKFEGLKEYVLVD